MLAALVHLARRFLGLHDAFDDDSMNVYLDSLGQMYALGGWKEVRPCN